MGSNPTVGTTLPDDFLMIIEGSSDSDGGSVLQDLDKEDCPRGDPNVEPLSDDDASESVGDSPMDSPNDILAAAEAICKQEGHRVYDKIRPPSCWSAKVLSEVVRRERLTSSVPLVTSQLKSTFGLHGLLFASQCSEDDLPVEADERLQSFFAYAVVVVGGHSQSSLEFPVLAMKYDMQVTDGLHLELPGEARDELQAAYRRNATSSMLKESELKVDGSKLCSEIGAAQRVICNGFADLGTAHTVFLRMDDITARAKMHLRNLSLASLDQ